MPREDVARAVDAMIQGGQIPANLREQTINGIEANLGSYLLRGDDYTNKTKALAEQRKQAENEIAGMRAQVDRRASELNEWQRAAQRQIQEADRIQSVLPELTARASAYEQVLKDYNMLDHVTVPKVPAAPTYTPQGYDTPQPPAQRPTPQGNYVTQETAAGALRDMMLLTGKVQKVAAQHQRLFGQPLEDDLLSHYLETGEDIEAHWRTKYAVTLKEQEIAQRNRDAEVAQIREQERAKLLQEMALDPARVTGTPFQSNQGGLSPLMDRYASSRALQHAATSAPGDNAAGNLPRDVAPELKPDIAMSRERVAAAVEMFHKNFSPDGVAITDRGRQLQQRYTEPTS